MKLPSPLPHDILTVREKRDVRVLRAKTKEVSFDKLSTANRRLLVRTMREIMQKAQGIGLSANQIGLDLKMFVARIEHKFYAVFNPRITARSPETALLEEGCLSVPGKYGTVRRTLSLTLEGFDQNGKRLRIKAWGLLAHVFQHEVDHLEGKLFIDKAERVYDSSAKERSTT